MNLLSNRRSVALPLPGWTAVLLALLMLGVAPGFTAEVASRGVVKGGAAHVAPDWFKASFLEIREDAQEAGDADKHLMLFFQLNDCPYCDRMLSESFENDPHMSFIRAHFDVIAINVQGDREVAFSERITVLEKELAELLKVRATPAILFLDADNKQVARVNGYRSPKRFQQVLDYVSSKSYRSTSLVDHLQLNRAGGAWALRAHPSFSQLHDLSAIDGPLAVILEDSGCQDCAEFHERLLSRADVVAELARFTVVRLDTDSREAIVDPAGNRTTAAGLARRLAMTYRPGVLLFAAGELIRRHDSLLYSFHFKESLRYVSGAHYRSLDYETFQARHREELLANGVDIDFSD